MAAAEVERIRAVLRMLLDSGDITPQGARMMEKVLTEVSW
jgi:hypothetical protein